MNASKTVRCSVVTSFLAALAFSVIGMGNAMAELPPPAIPTPAPVTPATPPPVVIPPDTTPAPAEPLHTPLLPLPVIPEPALPAAPFTEPNVVNPPNYQS